MENKVTVVIADGSEEYRGMLAEALEKTGEFHVVGEAGDGPEAVRIVKQTNPTFLLLDYVLPSLDGAHAIVARRAPGSVATLPGFVQVDAAARSFSGFAAEILLEMFAQHGFQRCNGDVKRFLRGLA